MTNDKEPMEDVVRRLEGRINLEEHKPTAGQSRLPNGSAATKVVTADLSRLIDAYRETPPINAKWEIGDLVEKKRGSSWRGKIVGYYQTEHTPIGYCVESIFEPGSVQVWPEAALTAHSGE